jgi:hypothetical protein
MRKDGLASTLENLVIYDEIDPELYKQASD